MYINVVDKFIFLTASSSSDSIVPETEKLYMEGRIVQKLECRPYGKNILKYFKYLKLCIIYAFMCIIFS